MTAVCANGCEGGPCIAPNRHAAVAHDPLRLDPEDPASVERLVRALRSVDPMVDDPKGQLFYVPTGLTYSQAIRDYARTIARHWASEARS